LHHTFNVAFHHFATRPLLATNGLIVKNFALLCHQ
ncbi:MAG: hypothetical protein ACI9VL_000238, partial [Colwellia sp.]